MFRDITHPVKDFRDITHQCRLWISASVLRDITHQSSRYHTPIFAISHTTFKF